MVGKLIKEKQKIVQEHAKIMTEKFLEVLETKRKAVSDNKSSKGFGFNLLDKVKASFNVDQATMVEMNGDQRLQYAKQWSRDAKLLLDALKSEPGYKSLLKDIDFMITFWKEELDNINEALSNAEGEEERKKLEKEKDKTMAL